MGIRAFDPMAEAPVAIAPEAPIAASVAATSPFAPENAETRLS